MAGKSRDKGSRGEREVVAIIHDLLGIKAARRVRQYVGDSDIIGVGRWCIEVKRHASASAGDIDRWWEQARRQVGSGEIPCLWWRVDRRPWRVRIPLRWLLEPGVRREDYGVEWAELSPDGWAMSARETLTLDDAEK